MTFEDVAAQLAGEPHLKSKEEVGRLTRRWVRRVLRHERDDKHRVVPTGKPAADAPRTWEELIRRLLTDRAWPAHRIEAKLAEGRAWRKGG